MNDCTLYDLQLAAYAAGELQQPDRGALEQHLATCADCRAELDRERELASVLGSLPEVECPASVTQDLTDKLGLAAPTAHVTRLPQAARNWWPAGLGLVAAALLAVLLVPGLLDQPLPDGTVVVQGDDGPHTYTSAEIAQARHDVIATLALAADILDRSRDRTVVNVFGTRLPDAVSGSLRPKGETGAGDSRKIRVRDAQPHDAHDLNNDLNQSPTGGNG